MKKKLVVLLTLLAAVACSTMAALTLSACDPTLPACGMENQPCCPNLTCDEGLVCLNDLTGEWGGDRCKRVEP